MTGKLHASPPNSVSTRPRILEAYEVHIVRTQSGSLVSLPGRANQGRDVYVERDLQWIANPWLSARCKVSRTAANDWT
jgi:hypothetical protein